MLPLSAFFPNDPIMSTPTNTSPEGATPIQAGLGVTSGPANSDNTISSGLLNFLAGVSLPFWVKATLLFSCFPLLSDLAQLNSESATATRRRGFEKRIIFECFLV